MSSADDKDSVSSAARKKHRFKSIDGAVRRVRELEKQIAELSSILEKRLVDIELLSKLASDKPEFLNPLEAFAAQAVRDRVLKNLTGKRSV